MDTHEMLRDLEQEFAKRNFPVTCTAYPSAIRLQWEELILELSPYKSILRAYAPEHGTLEVFKLRKASFSWAQVADWCKVWFEAEFVRVSARRFVRVSARRSWINQFIVNLNSSVVWCTADQHLRLEDRRELDAVIRVFDEPIWFMGPWYDAEIKAAVDQAKFMLAVSVGPCSVGGYRVWIKRRKVVDSLLTRYEAHGARSAGKAVVQASETFDTPEAAAQWVLEHNGIMLDLLRTLPAEVAAFDELQSMAKTMDHVEVIRNVRDFQVRVVNFPNAFSVKQFLLFLQEHETWTPR